MHYCPECSHACYCHGDIDDIVVETPEYSDARCTCCDAKWAGDDEDPDDYADGDTIYEEDDDA